jgi:ParB/RepB/Spo0J family partition protein
LNRLLVENEAGALGALKEVPVRIVELSDAAVRESQLTENLLREDVHPYEEALALTGLLHLEGARYDIASIASRLGKSPSYVLQKIRLTELESSIAEAFIFHRSVAMASRIQLQVFPNWLWRFDLFRGSLKENS